VPGAPSATSDVEYEVRVAARPETVFAYFTDPARFVQWMGAEATLDPRPGGICRVAFRPVDLREGPEVVMSGEFVELDPPRRLAISWGWEVEPLRVPPRSSLVEVSLTPDGDGTMLRLVHRRLPDTALDFHRAGWGHYLPRLAIAAAGADPGPDRLQRED
jgi:uncharacterized protein YndB with AHSA1/START domain